MRPLQVFVSFVSFVVGVGAMGLGAAEADERSRALTAKAFEAAYNLDYAESQALLEQAIAADPTDADAHRAMAVTAWLRIGFLRGSVTVDDYIGNVSRPNINMLPPPKDEAERFHRHITRALELAEQALARNGRDPDALYRIGSIVGVQASYGATVEGRVLASFRHARRAFDTHEQVLEIDPARKDAGLIVGMYRYIVAALSWPIRMMAYVVGFGGDSARGIRMVEEAAAHPGISQVEAKFALLLIYNRERRYTDAMTIALELQRRFPRNRLLWLEGGATQLRAGRHAAAIEQLSTGLEMFAKDRRERMFGEEALWRYKRAAAAVRLNRRDEAAKDLERVFALEARDWVTGRAHAERGRLFDLAGQRERARQEYRLARELADSGNDPAGRAEAESLLDRPFQLPPR